MRVPLYNTKRCELFEGIAIDVWHSIIRAHRNNRNRKEEGITADLIIDILEYRNNAPPNFDVYARDSWNENEYGSDIDVFVETTYNNYVWFALQAKVLKKNGRYNTLRDSSDGIMQWDKLRQLEGLTGCKGYYLLYNGMDGWKHNGTDLCGIDFNEEQFGCSLVEITKIEELGTKKRPNGTHINPTFYDIHPQHAQPWRILTCCRHNVKQFTTYKKEIIEASDPDFKKINSANDLDNLDEIENTNNNVSDGNPITTAMRQAKWEPDIRIIIDNTSNLHKHKK